MSRDLQKKGQVSERHIVQGHAHDSYGHENELRDQATRLNLQISALTIAI